MLSLKNSINIFLRKTYKKRNLINKQLNKNKKLNVKIRPNNSLQQNNNYSNQNNPLYTNTLNKATKNNKLNLKNNLTQPNSIDIAKQKQKDYLTNLQEAKNLNCMFINSANKPSLLSSNNKITPRSSSITLKKFNHLIKNVILHF